MDWSLFVGVASIALALATVFFAWRSLVAAKEGAREQRLATDQLKATVATLSEVATATARVSDHLNQQLSAQQISRAIERLLRIGDIVEDLLGLSRRLVPEDEHIHMEALIGGELTRLGTLVLAVSPDIELRNTGSLAALTSNRVRSGIENHVEAVREEIRAAIRTLQAGMAAEANSAK